MHFDWTTLALQTINFIVLVWLLQRFLYRPVLRLVDARRDAIRRQEESARAAAEAAKTELAAIASERQRIAAEREAVITGAMRDADAAAKARRVQAEHEAAAILESGRKSLADERGAALAEARRAAFDLGASIAARLLGEVPEPLRAEATITRVEQYLRGLPGKERDALAHTLGNGGTLGVTTASALPPAVQESWRRRLGAVLGAEVAVAFVVDPAILDGAELNFPGAILRLTWRSVLGALAAEVEADAAAR